MGLLGKDFAAASHPAWWVVAGCGLAVLVIGVAVTGPRGTASAARTALDLDEPAAAAVL